MPFGLAWNIICFGLGHAFSHFVCINKSWVFDYMESNAGLHDDELTLLPKLVNKYFRALWVWFMPIGSGWEMYKSDFGKTEKRWIYVML